MKPTLLLFAVVVLTGCEALQPFAHVDADGYEAGVRGTWKAAAQSVASAFNKSAPAAGRNGSFKQIVKSASE
jgi:hypothetical protein